MSADSDLALPNLRRVMVLGRPVDSYPTVPPEVGRGTVRRITEVGEAILQRRGRDVVDFGSAELAGLIDDMFATMYVAEGVGLAANQIDVDLRLFVWDCTDGTGVRHVGHICNPVLDDQRSTGSSLVDGSEGCLSVPGAHADLARLDRAVVRGQDLDGHLLVITGEDYFARCLQHETDHVNGRLYLDRLSGRARKDALREMQELRDDVIARRARRAVALGDEP